ncbi:uncharacterized protein PSFLO_02378 [Pseudozyma flocculosa]|uniref:Uncharacterized protein n=1 Tax=Pseudozyma flocculosa TaxID=84751 RepID=A0A5C3EZR2_9BASI|nr:uncharacterized protein PSFLO_02378 [Pseudozyma flocculosa]
MCAWLSSRSLGGSLGLPSVVLSVPATLWKLIKKVHTMSAAPSESSALPSRNFPAGTSTTNTHRRDLVTRAPAGRWDGQTGASTADCYRPGQSVASHFYVRQENGAARRRRPHIVDETQSNTSLSVSQRWGIDHQTSGRFGRTDAKLANPRGTTSGPTLRCKITSNLLRLTPGQQSGSYGRPMM